MLFCSEIGFRRHILESDLNAPETVQHDLAENIERTEPSVVVDNERGGEEMAVPTAPVANGEINADVLAST